MVKTPEPMTTLKAAPKWQKALDVKENSYHEYSDSNHYSQDRNSKMVTEALIEIQELTLQEHLIAQTPLHIVQILV